MRIRFRCIIEITLIVALGTACATPGSPAKPGNSERICTQEYAGRWQPMDTSGARRKFIVVPDTATSAFADLSYTFGPMGLVSIRGVALHCSGNSIIARYGNGNPVGFVFEKSGADIRVVASPSMQAPTTGPFSATDTIPAFRQGTVFKKE